MGINSNDLKISQASADNHYPYYDDEQVAQVYYNGTLVWQKYTTLPFTFKDNAVTGYTGSDTSIVIPDSYYTMTDIDGTIIYTSTVVGEATTVTAIADDAFADNATITEVTIPSSITTIGERAFQKCYNLTTVNMSATPESIGYCAFALTNITELSPYMYNCTSLGLGAFATQKGWHLKSPSDVTSLDGDEVLNRLLATNMGANLSEGDYLGAGPVYIIRSRFNVLKSGGTNGSSGGSFTCTASITYSGGTFESLNCTLALGGYGYGYTYCIASTTVPTATASATKNSNPSNFSSWTGLQVGNFSPVAGETDDHDLYARVTSTCLAKGTLITLADGTQKPIEDIKYNNLLLVWNFQTGSYDYQYPLVVGTGSHAICKTRITLEDKSYIDICHSHDIYDPVANTFRKYGEGAISELPKEPLYVMKYLTTTTYESKRVISISMIDEESDCYCLMTGGSITAFANNIMIGSDFLNHTNLTSENKFPNSFTQDQSLCYTYDKFKEEIFSKCNKYLILGLNLNYLHYYYEKGVTNYYEILAPFILIPSPQTEEDKFICTIGILDGGYFIESEHLEDEEIILPDIHTLGKTQWYVVGEYKYLKPGDKLKINFSTLIRAV